MSTNFYVYPSKKYIPTFREVIEITNLKINQYLKKLDIKESIILEVGVYDIKTNKKIDFNLNDKLIFNEDEYAWFYINGVSGGTDTYFIEISELDKEVWQEECINNEKACEIKEVINDSLNIGYHWCFRKSAGQPGIITLLYGLLAIELAKITNGFIYSDDGAWDYSQFPVLADDFMEMYFNIDLTSKKEYKDLVNNSIISIINDLKK